MQLNTISEEELTLLLHKKDVKALEIIYDKYAEALFGVIFQIVKDRRLAEEVLQTTYLKVWINAQKYDPKKARLFTWLLNIARNAGIDKTRSKDFRSIKRTTNIEELSGHINKIDTGGNWSMNHMDVWKFHNKLGKKEKEIIELIYFKGFTHVEAAKELNLPLGTVKTKLRKAIQLLRKWML